VKEGNSVNEYTRGEAAFRDLVIAHIIGLQNNEYWKVEGEGYQALQALLKLITERYGSLGSNFKG